MATSMQTTHEKAESMEVRPRERERKKLFPWKLFAS